MNNKEIELIGIPGSGKSTVLSSIVERDNVIPISVAEAKATSYVFGSFFNIPPRFMVMIESILHPITGIIKKTSGLSSRGVDLFSMEHPKYLNLSYILLKKYSNDRERVRKTADILLSMAETKGIVDYYYRDDKKIVLDEGFIHRTISIFCPPNQPYRPEAQNLIEYIENAPKPDKVIYLDAQPKICEKRMSNRKTGYPSTYTHLNSNEMLNILKNMRTVFEQVCTHLESSSDTKFVRVNANDTKMSVNKNILEELNL